MGRTGGGRRSPLAVAVANAVVLAAGLLLFLFGAATLFLPVGTAGEALRPADAPPNLAATGLYSDLASRTIDPRNLPFSPQYPLWSDGATKHRWIHLPEGTAIDASDPDVWVFPAGTKVWKEFSLHGRPVETRLIEALGNGEWRFAAYAWNADGSDALLAPVRGLRDVVEIRPGIRHNIPGVLDCRVCHEGNQVEILGFSALQLSPDRDPNAPNAETLTPNMVDLATLIRQGLLRSYPPDWSKQPPRIDAKSPTARAALGYLHANCGNCHNPANPLAKLGLILRHSVAPGAAGEPALATTLNQTGEFTIPGATRDESFRLRSGDPAHSAILVRMESRNPLRQMPPLGTKIADASAVDLVRRWILEDRIRE